MNNLLINSTSQTCYIEKMVRFFCQHESNPVDSPMEFNLTLSISKELNDDTEYRAIIGALLYVARHSHPDIAYSVNKLCNASTKNEGAKKKHNSSILANDPNWKIRARVNVCAQNAYGVRRINCTRKCR